MKQIIKNKKTGKVLVEEVPLPSISEGMVLIANSFSVLDPDSESAFIRNDRNLYSENHSQTSNIQSKISDRLNTERWNYFLSAFGSTSAEAIGMSTAGTVIESKDTQGLFKKGDRVACGGIYHAVHSEYIAVPEELIIKIPTGISMEEAAFAMIGALCLGSVKTVEPQLGKQVCVVGLDLRGQIIGQLLKASGCNVTGVDRSQWHRENANQLSFDQVFDLNDTNLILNSLNYTEYKGFDEVFIITNPQNNIPLQIGAEITKYRGQITVVGPSRLTINTTKAIHAKELNLKMAGTINTIIESDPLQYSDAHTLLRQDMSLFLSLVSNKQINLAPLITYIFNVWEVQKAFQIVTKELNEPFIGLLIKYLSEDNIAKQPPTYFQVNNKPLSKVNIAWIADQADAINANKISFLQKYGATLSHLVLADSLKAKQLAQKNKFNICSSNYQDILEEEALNVVYISHIKNPIKVIRESLQAKKSVFLDSFPVEGQAEVDQLIKLKEEGQFPLMFNFHRRFAPGLVKTKAIFENLLEPILINIQSHIYIPEVKDSLSKPAQVAGQIKLEIANWIDVMQFLTDSFPVKVYAVSTGHQTEKSLFPNSIVINFEDGSIGQLMLLDNKAQHLSKDSIEVFSTQQSVQINGKKGGYMNLNRKVKAIRGSGNGEKECLNAFLDAIEKGANSPITFHSIINTVSTTLTVMDSLASGQPLQIHQKI